ncbi:MAG: hypothetical protein HC802_00140 [Caldilineaceae bacterium]|nr:hypothetical protein [Caldilineaceae bacterium]
MTQPRRIPAIVYLLIAFTASRAAYMLMGVSFDASSLPSSWHILDVAHLQNDLLSSLYWLHSQPPGFNLLIGAVLQVAGDQFSILLAALYWLTGFGIYYLVYRILRLSGTGYWPAFLLATLFIIFPERILYENWLFTTWLISGLITFAAYALWKYQAGGKRRYLTGFLAAVTLICLSRSMFLIVYLLVSIALLFFCFYPSKVRFIAYVSLLATALVLLLYLKNFALFGFFGPSSWTGMNLWRIASRVVSVEEKAMLVEAGDIPATALVTEFHPVADYAPELIQVPRLWHRYHFCPTR